MKITVMPRPQGTKGEKKRRLRMGLIPGAIYGRGLETTLVDVPAKAIVGVLLAESGLNTVLEVTVAGSESSHEVMVDNLERDRITRNFLNIGFHEIRRGDTVHAQIPIHLQGMPQDVVLNGALLEQTLDTIEVTGQPSDLPAHLDVDVSQMKTGEVLRVADLPHNEKLTFTTHDDVPIVAVHVSTTAQQVEESEATAPVSEGMPTGQDALTELRADADASSDSVTGTEVI